MPLIFGLPFLGINDVICDHKRRTCIIKDRKLNYNLLIPHVKQEPPPQKLKLCDQLLQFKAFKKDTLQELLLIFPKKWKDHVLPDIPETQPNYIASILQHIKSLEIEASMTNMEDNLCKMCI